MSDRPSRWGLARKDWGYRRLYRRRRYLFKQLWQTLVQGYYGETCQECATKYISWHAPDPLYEELKDNLGGLYCLECFDRKARTAGIWCMWTPMVVARRPAPGSERKWDMTSNWWHDKARDELMMGVPDPSFMDRGHETPQPPWDGIARVLAQRSTGRKAAA